jgi:hypothetical protein
MMTSNRGWLIAITVVVVGIFIVMVMSLNHETDGDKIGESVSDIVDSADEGAKEFREEVKDEIDDNTKDSR